jgi:putative PEP-CTERM system TPR-repeat lipoprotein
MAILSLPHRPRSLLRSAAILLLLTAAGCDQTKSAGEYIKNARTSRAAGDISTAIADLKNALRQDPKNLPARILLAQFYLDLPDPIGAEALLWRARQDGAPDLIVIKPLAQAELLMGNPQLAVKTAEPPADAPPELRASLLAIKAEAYIGLGRAQDAQDALDAGLALDPHSVDVLAAMTRYALAAGNLVAAQNRLADALKQDTRNVALLDLQGTVAFAAQDYALSIQAYAALLKAEPWNLNARLGLAGAQIAAGKSEAADANLGSVLKVAPADPRANYLSALIAYRNHDFVTAQARVQRALNAAKNFAPALLLAGASAYGLHQYEQANAFLSQFVYQVPQYAQARKLLAAVQIALGRPADAVKTLAQIVDSSPGDPQLFALIGAASAQTGDFAAADRYLEKALSLQPDSSALRTELGIARVALGRTDAGIQELEEASRQDPADALRSDVALFIAYFKQKDYDKALGAAERLEQAYPNDATGFDFAGAAHLAKADETAARTELLRARALRPGDAIASRSLAALAIHNGDTAAASQFYGEILAANPRDAAAYVSLAELQDQQGLRSAAIATLKKAIEQNPDAEIVRVSLGQLYLFDHNAQDALGTVEPILVNAAKNAGALEVAGQADLALGNVDAALSAFKTLVAVQPEQSSGHRYLAAAYLAAGKLDLALTEANKSVAADPQDPAAKMILARIHIAAGGADNARLVLAELATQYPNDAFVAELQKSVGLTPNHNRDAIERTRLALTEARAGHIEMAEAALKEWLETHPEDIAPRQALADIELAAKRLDAARAQYEAVLARDPDNAAAENNLAWILSRTGEVHAALDHAAHAASLAPDKPRVLDTLGVVYLQSLRVPEAMESLSRAAQAAPADPEIQFHLAQALAGAGENVRARSVLRDLLATDRRFDERDQAQTLLQSLGG